MIYDDVCCSGPAGLAERLRRDLSQCPPASLTPGDHRWRAHDHLCGARRPDRQTSGHLENVGARAGDIVGVALGDNADHIAALLATAWLGAVILPMDVRWTGEEKRRIAIISAPAWSWCPTARRRFPTSKPLYSTKPGGRASRRHHGKGGLVRSREQPLLLSLSSGTTGSPKGPMVTHGHTLSRLYIYTISLTFNEADRFITATPLYFGGARYMTMAYLFMGATVVLFPAPYQPEELARAINDQRITSLFLVPTLRGAGECSRCRNRRCRCCPACDC